MCHFWQGVMDPHDGHRACPCLGMEHLWEDIENLCGVAAELPVKEPGGWSSLFMLGQLQPPPTQLSKGGHVSRRHSQKRRCDRTPVRSQGRSPGKHAPQFSHKPAGALGEWHSAANTSCHTCLACTQPFHCLTDNITKNLWEMLAAISHGLITTALRLFGLKGSPDGMLLWHPPCWPSTSLPCSQASPEEPGLQMHLHSSPFLTATPLFLQGRQWQGWCSARYCSMALRKYSFLTPAHCISFTSSDSGRSCNNNTVELTMPPCTAKPRKYVETMRFLHKEKIEWCCFFHKTISIILMVIKNTRVHIGN